MSHTFNIDIYSHGWTCRDCGYQMAMSAIANGVVPPPCPGPMQAATGTATNATRPFSFADESATYPPELGETTATPTCLTCERELCPELDTYWGKDPFAAKQCAPCRDLGTIDGH